MSEDKRLVEVDVINNVDKRKVEHHVYHAIDLGYHVNVEPVIYEEEESPSGRVYVPTEQIRYQITILKEV